MQKYYIPFISIFDKRKFNLINDVNDNTEQWRVGLIKELMACRDGICDSILSHDQVQLIIYDLCVS